MWNRYKFLCGRNLITYDEYIKSVSDYLSRIGDTNPEKVAKTELRREIERYYKTTTQSELSVSQNTESSEGDVLLTSNDYPLRQLFFCKLFRKTKQIALLILKIAV